METLEGRELFCVEHALTETALTRTFGRQGLLYPGGPRARYDISLEPVGANPGQMNGSAIFGGGIYGAAAASYTPRADGLPLLNSKPGAPFTVFLDFDGWSGSGFSGQENWQPYDTNGNFASFSATEAASIAEGWRRMASYMSPFDVNVTTVQPNIASTTKNWTWNIISNNVSGGYAYVGQIGTSRPAGFNDSGHLLSRTSGIMHELGHVFSLQHQSIYDANAVKTAEYRNQYDSIHGVIMGIDYNGTPSKWVYGHPATSAVGVQDDVAIIASKIKPFQPAGGDGFRVDDIGGTSGSASSLTPGPGGVQSAYGIVERLADADAFRLTSPGGWYTLSVIPDSPSGLDAKLEVLDANGNLLALSDAQARIDTAVTLNLPAGEYFGLVKSHGNYGDIGAYEFRAAPANAVNPPATNALPAPADVTTALAAGTGVTVSWSPVAGAANYVVERSLDGVAFVTASSTVASTDTSYTDANLAGSHRYVYRVRAKDATGMGAASAHSEIVNRPSGVTGTRYTQTNGTQIVIDWLERPESGGETGYRVERSTNGGNFVNAGIVNPNVTIFNDTGLTVGQTYQYRIVPLSAAGDGPAVTLSNIKTRLGAASSFRFSSKSATSLTLAWTDMAAESGYRLERSFDGVSWSTLANLAAGITSYTDSGLAAAGEYYYRIAGTDAAGAAGLTDTIFTATTPTTGMSSPWVSNDIGGVTPGNSGTVGAQGATSLTPATGVIRLVSAGGDVTGTDDQFRFTHQPYTGDGSIIAKVTSVENTNAAARVGVMFRESTATGSRVAFVGVTASNGVTFSTRTTTDGNVSSPTSARITGVAAPYWVKLQRVGNVFTAFASPDGVAWTRVGSPVTIAMSATVRVGIAGASRDANRLNTSTLSNVELELPNAAPIARGDSITINEDTPGAIAVLANDTDGDGNTLSVTSVNPPANGTAVLNPDKTVTYTPAANFNGLDTFTYTISDGNGGTSAATVSVTVTPVNDAPTLGAIPDQSAPAGSGTRSITLTGIGTGASNEAQALTVAAASSDTTVTPHPTVTYHNDGTATLTYTPSAEGSATITVTVTDDGGTANGGVDTTERVFNLTVGAAPLPAWLGAGSAVTWNADTRTLTLTGAARIVGDPAADLPLIVADGPSAVLTIAPSGASRVNVGGLTLANGAVATLASVGAGRSAANHHVLVVHADTLNIDSSSTLDLTDNDLVLDYTVGASPAAGVEVMVGAGFNGGDWLGKRITSSAANADRNFALGVADNSKLVIPFSSTRLFAGQAVDSTAVLVKFTHRVDLDLDGVITTNDATILNSNYSEGGAGFWSVGDLDFDGLFTSNDATLFNSYYNESLGAM